jgi:hypothetical protein
MRRLTLAAAAGWPIFIFNPHSIPAPADYLAQQRCLAVFNIASAVPLPEDPEDMSPLLAMREMVSDAYDRLEHSLASRTGLTAEQSESGMATFEIEQRRWLDLYGEAADNEAQDLLVNDLVKEVDACLPLVPK